MLPSTAAARAAAQPLPPLCLGAQAMDRAHRLGQRRTVNVYRLLVRGTLEEQIMSLQEFKKDVATTLVNQDNVSLGAMDTSNLLDLFGDAKARGVGALCCRPRCCQAWCCCWMCMCAQVCAQRKCIRLAESYRDCGGACCCRRAHSRRRSRRRQTGASAAVWRRCWRAWATWRRTRSSTPRSSAWRASSRGCRNSNGGVHYERQRMSGGAAFEQQRACKLLTCVGVA